MFQQKITTWKLVLSMRRYTKFNKMTTIFRKNVEIVTQPNHKFIWHFFLDFFADLLYFILIELFVQSSAVSSFQCKVFDILLATDGILSQRPILYHFEWIYFIYTSSYWATNKSNRRIFNSYLNSLFIRIWRWSPN